jgi:hypothetical protein
MFIGFLSTSSSLSIFIQFCDNKHSQCLVQTTQDRQSFFVRRPVHTHDRLTGNHFTIQQLHIAHDPHGHIVLGHSGSVLWIMIFVEIESSVATASHKQVAILWQMTNTPDGGFVGSFGETGEALGGVLGAHVEYSEFAF